MKSRRRVPGQTCHDHPYQPAGHLVAHVGMHVKEGRQRGIPVKTFTIPIHDVDRAIADGEEEGSVKIHVREGSDKILGATTVTRHAGRLTPTVFKLARRCSHTPLRDRPIDLTAVSIALELSRSGRACEVLLSRPSDVSARPRRPGRAHRPARLGGDPVVSG